MAITLKQASGAYDFRLSAHSPLWFVVSSDNTAQDNFKFVFEVFIGGVKVATLKRWPHPSTIYGSIDVAPIVRSYLSNNYLLEPSPASGAWYVDYDVKVGEEYGSPPTTYLNLNSWLNVRAYNSYEDITGTYLKSQIFTKQDKLLTSRPMTYEGRKTELISVPYWNYSDPILTPYDLNVYDSAGGLLITEERTMLLSHNVVDCSLANVDLITDTIIANAASLELVIGSETFTINYCEARAYTGRTVHFLNKYGGYETYSFTGKSRMTADIDRKEYGLQQDQLYDNGSTVAMTPLEEGTTNVYRGSKRTAHVGKRYKYKLSSAHLSDEEFTWLAELVASPMVYLYMPDFDNVQKAMPVKILNTNYDYLRIESDKVNCLEIDVEILTDFNSQFA